MSNESKECREKGTATEDELKKGHSTLLKNITSEYHYHTVSAPSAERLDFIQTELQKRGFLAKLKEYEPIDFGEGEKN